MKSSIATIRFSPRRCAALLAIIIAGLSSASAQTPTSTPPTPHFYEANFPVSHRELTKAVGINKLAELGIKIIDSLRGGIKTGADSKAKLVNRQVQDTTVERLVSLKRPHLIFLRFARVRPVEFTTYKVQGTLEAYRLQLDGDYHLILRGESGKTMTVEIPTPKSVDSSSPFRDQIVQAREDFANNFYPTRKWKASNKFLTVTGIGFWDFPHFQHGAARNTVEIHPVLAIEIY